MAKKPTGKSDTKRSTKSSAKKGTAVARVASTGSGSGGSKDHGFDASEVFVKLMQSPLVAELVAVAATAALASLAEHGFSGGHGKAGKRAGKAVKQAGKAAAAAIGRRLGTEIDEIKSAAKNAKK